MLLACVSVFDFVGVYLSVCVYYADIHHLESFIWIFLILFFIRNSNCVIVRQCECERKRQKVMVSKSVESATASERIDSYNDRLYYAVRVWKLIEMSVLEQLDGAS